MPQDPTLIGQKLSHYTIQGRLGAGGMGVVYRAYDTRLERTVAIKVVGGENPAISPKQLLKEARSASALNHPNICTIYELGQTPECSFISMEYLDGVPLRELLSGGGLPPERVITLGIQIAGAMAHAHDHGVIHRDLKSTNVIVLGDNRIKVLDFGLALRQIGGLNDLNHPESLTVAACTIAGTLAYMSPEVLRGLPPNVLSDLWSIGVLLFEMSCGALPFAGSTQFELTGAILHADLPPLPAQVPQGLRSVIEKSFAKNPNSRYPGAIDLRDALEALRVPASHPSATIPQQPAARPSVLVLPFENLSPDKDDDYFSDGLTDEIITDLSNVRALRVISRTSSMRLKGMDNEITKISENLKVQYVLEGSVRHIGKQLRVTSKLIDTTTDASIWADKFTGSFEDVFAIQEQVSRSIVEALKVNLTPEEDKQLVERPMRNMRAYEAYLRAKREMLRFTREALDRAVEYIQSSIQIEGENTLLLSALGQIYWQYVNAGITGDPVYLDKADECARQILAREPESHHGHRLQGLVCAHRGDVQGCLVRLKRALAGDPNDTDTLLWIGLLSGICGKAREAREWTQRLLEIDPLTPLYHILPGALMLMEGEFDDASESLAKSYNANLDNPGARLLYGQALVMANRLEQADQILEALAKDMADSPFAQIAVLYRAAIKNDKPQVEAGMTSELEAAMGGDPQYAWMFAQCFALIDDRDRAIEWLQRAFDRGFINYPLLSTYDPLLVKIRNQPAFQALMRDIATRWKAFEL